VGNQNAPIATSRERFVTRRFWVLTLFSQPIRGKVIGTEVLGLSLFLDQGIPDSIIRQCLIQANTTSGFNFIFKAQTL